MFNRRDTGAIVTALIKVSIFDTVAVHEQEKQHMIIADLPENEAARLAALYQLLCLDTPPEERFDRIVQFAATEFDVPIVLLSLVDHDRLWFKAKVGLDFCEAPREVSMCSHAILVEEPMVVPDTRLDPRFADNPLVTGPPYIGFYAGAPLETERGIRVGTLCLIDTKPRQFDAIDIAILKTLRTLIVRELNNDVTDLAG